MKRRLVAGVVSLIVAGAMLPMLVAAPAAAATFPSGFSDTVVAGGLGAPTATTQLPDGRFLVTSQEGKLWIVTNRVPSVALDISTRVCGDSEMGLLGVTPDPNFASTGWIYVFYTARTNDSCALNGNDPGGAKNRVSRFQVSASTVNPNSELILLDNMPEWGGNHNGGDVRVASDGTLFVTVGDGGAGSPVTNPSDLSLPNGKILRVTRLGTVPGGNPYGGVSCKTSWGPPGSPRVCGEIWADGLRNPFRLGSDMGSTRFRINDVGAGTWEEVSEAIAGGHYGWPCREGPAVGPSPGAGCREPITDPVLWYNHSTGCNVETGGAFVPPNVWPGFDNAYLWVDFGCGRLFLAQPGQTGTPPAVLATGMQGTTDLEFFTTTGGTSLFYTTYANGGQLRRVLGAPVDRWERQGGVLTAAPAAAAWSAGRLDVFVKGADDQLWHKWFQNGWSGWAPLGGTLADAPAVAAWSAGRLDVFVKGADNQLWHKFFENGWSGWEPLGGTLTDAPAVAAWSAGRLDVFVKGADNQLWHKFYENGWSGWELLGGTLTDAPATAAWSAGRLDVFVKGADYQLWHKWYQNGWSGWEPLGGTLADAPATAAWSAGRLDVFVKGADYQLWHKWYQNGWSGWEPLGGTLTSGPAADAWSAGRLDVFVKGADNQLWHKWYDGTWNG